MSEPDQAKKQSDEDALYQAAEASEESPMAKVMQRPAPIDRTPAGSHGSYQTTSAQPEIEPLDWRQFVKPKSPGGASYSVVEGLEPDRMPGLANTHRDVATNDIQAHGWLAYTMECRAVDEQQRILAREYNAFMEAHKSGDLQALNFVLPSAAWEGDASTLANEQRVGGTVMNSLFRSNGSLNVSKSDQHAMEQVGESVRAGGPAKTAHNETNQADHNLRAKLENFDAKSNDVESARADIEAAELNLEAVKLRHEVAEDQDALEDAKKNAELVKSTLEFVTGGLLKRLITEESSEILESVGAMASYAVGRSSGHAIANAEAKLAIDTKKLQSVEGKQAQKVLDVAKSKARSALLLFKSARQELLVAMGKRQAAYDRAGSASAGAGGDASSRRKISGVMSAIPATEFVLGLARNIVSRTKEQPKYTTAAGAGFHMASAAHQSQASHFVGALDQIEYVRLHFEGIARQWSARLATLKKAQVLMGGARPQDNEESVSLGSEPGTE